MRDIVLELRDFKTKHRIRASKIGKQFYYWTMTGRSLPASQEGITKARTALRNCSLSQVALATELKISRSTVTNFFAGKPIDRQYFLDICERLSLEWEEVVAKPPSLPDEKAYRANTTDIDALVQEVREKIKPYIQEHCGTMRVLDMTHPIGLNDIYTDINILEKITGRRRKEIDELVKECNFEHFDRFGLGRTTEKRVPGLEAVKKNNKLMILGKPGAGKTTFLKYLTVQSIQGNFKVELVPVFITLKDFAEAPGKPGLVEYISQQLGSYNVINTQIIEIFKSSRALILLDGLDEVREEDNQRVLKEIKDFSARFRDSFFVMTCRIAAREYTFEKFTEVEIADFDDRQISTFANNWFTDKVVTKESFLKRLEENERIYELATNPLLLTLLCLVFEEAGDFPANRSELYKEGIDALLKKWDAKRGVQRDQLVYKKLSVQRKEDLLSKIALNTFEQSDYFFKQKVAEQHIIEYIRNLPDASTDPEVLQLDGERVLKSIEAQHGLLVERAKGIYSFSHLTFHEYFTAREFVVVKQSSNEALKNLVSYLMEKRWQEVFLLAVGMSPNADNLLLLIKEKADSIFAKCHKLQDLLKWMWIKPKYSSSAPDSNIAAFRLLYIGIDYRDYYESMLEVIWLFDNLIDFLKGMDILIKEKVSAFELNTIETHLNKIICEIDERISTVDYWDEDLKYSIGQLINGNDDDEILLLFDESDYEVADSVNINIMQNYINNYVISELINLKQNVPNPYISIETFEYWWIHQGKVWKLKLLKVYKRLKKVIDIFNLSHQENKLLNQYCYANLLLLQCLNSDCYVSREVRQQIEDTLLLPIAEIEKLKQ